MGIFAIAMGLALLLLIPTAYAGIIGAPWAPTRIAVVRKAFDELGVSEKDVLVDLGAGDSKVTIEAAKRGAKAIGYELSPIMWAIGWLRTVLIKNAGTHLRNFYRTSLPSETTIIFAFLMPNNMKRLQEYLQKQNIPKAKHVLAYAFPFKDIPPTHIFRENKCAPLYLYKVADLY